MPFEINLNKNSVSEEKISKKDEELFKREDGEFKELDPDIEIKPEPLAYDADSEDTSLSIELDRAEATLAKAKEIEQNDPFRSLKQSVDDSAYKALISTNGVQKEELIRFHAMRLYDDIHKAAKLFLKDWCIIHHWRQRWTNPLKDKGRDIRAHHFIPKVYNLEIVNTDDQKTTQSLAVMEVTARDACITAAKKCGFDTSPHRAKIFARVPNEVLQILLNEPKYLHEQRILHIQSEYRQQAENVRYVSKAIRERWLYEIAAHYKDALPNNII